MKITSCIHLCFNIFSYIQIPNSSVFIFRNELFAFCHHHFTKFIKVHGTRSIFIKFLKNTHNFFFCKRGKKLGDDFSQCIVGDESLTLPIIQLEGIFQLFLHFFQWRILNKESCTKLVKLSGSIFINFMEKVSKLLLSWSEAHGSHDLSKIITRQKFLLLCIKQIKANLQALNFISSKVGQV